MPLLHRFYTSTDVAYVSVTGVGGRVVTDVRAGLRSKPAVKWQLIFQSLYWLGYGLDDRGFDSRQGQGLSFVTASRPALEPTQPSFQWVPGFFGLVKAAGAWN